MNWLSANDAAAELRINKRTIYRAIADGRLRAYRFGKIRTGELRDTRDFRIKREDWEEFIRKSMQRTDRRRPGILGSRLGGDLIETARRQVAQGRRER